MRKSIGFIGGGKITKLLLRGFDNRKIKFKKIVVADTNPVVLERLRGDFPFIKGDSVSVSAAQDIVFLGIDQSIAMDTLGLISNEFRTGTILVSLLPDLSLAKLSLRLPEIKGIARMMPYPATYINEAYIPVSFSPDFPETQKDDVLELFDHLGKTVVVPEDKLPIYSTMSAVVPAYFWYQWKELINMGEEMGLTEQETVDFLSNSIPSSLHLSYRSGLPEEHVINLMPVNPVEENEAEIRGIHRRRLVDLYRRIRPEMTETEPVRSSHR